MSFNKKFFSTGGIVASSSAGQLVNTENFGIETWSGNSTNNRDFTTLGFQPDLVWVKSTTADPVEGNAYHALFDSVRTGYALRTNATSAESTTTSQGYVSSYLSNGFRLSAGSSGSYPYFDVNRSGMNYIGWAWKAGGAAVSGTGTNAQNITYSANPDAGFSIVKFSTNGSTSYTATHGLNQAPELVIAKVTTVASNWLVYSSSLGISKYMNLDTSAQALIYSNLWNGMSSTHIGGSNAAYGGTNTFVNYCFHSVDGYQKVGTYNGNGTTQTIYTDSNGDGTGTGGFDPRFVMFKRTDSTGEWTIIDSQRNDGDDWIYANLANGNSANINRTTLVTGGFALDGTASSCNESGSTYIYLAIA